jgi:hypothetical protein
MGPDAGEKWAPVKAVGTHELWAGNSTKPIRAVSDAEAALILNFVQYHCQFSKEYIGERRSLEGSADLGRNQSMCPKLLVIFFMVCTLLAILPSCSPSRLAEAARLLDDIDAGTGPSELKALTQFPLREAVFYGGRDGSSAFAGDLYSSAELELAGMVLVPGVARKGKDDPRLVAFATTLARARFMVLVPDLPRLRDLRIGPEDAAGIAAAAHYLNSRLAGRGKIGMTAVSYAVGPAVLALFKPGIAEKVDFVLAIGGYYDMTAVITFFTTGYYREGESEDWRHRRANEYGKWAFVRGNTGRLDSRADGALLAQMAERKLDNMEAHIDDLVSKLSPEGKSVHALLVNNDPEQVETLIAALPSRIVEDIAALDLTRRNMASLGVSFVLVHGHDDPIIPETESMALARALAPGRSKLFLLESLNHVDPRPAGLTDRLRLLRAIYTVLELRDSVVVW